MKRKTTANQSARRRAVSFLLVSLLAFICFLHATFSLTVSAAEYVSLTNSLDGEQLEPVYSFQMDKETTHLYFFEGYFVWVSSRYHHLSSPISVEQEQESGETVTVTIEYGYLTSDHALYLMKTPEIHEHDHHNFTIECMPPYDNNRRRFDIFS